MHWWCPRRYSYRFWACPLYCEHLSTLDKLSAKKNVILWNVQWSFFICTCISVISGATEGVCLSQARGMGSHAPLPSSKKYITFSVSYIQKWTKTEKSQVLASLGYVEVYWSYIQDMLSILVTSSGYAEYTAFTIGSLGVYIGGSTVSRVFLESMNSHTLVTCTLVAAGQTCFRKVVSFPLVGWMNSPPRMSDFFLPPLVELCSPWSP